MNLAVRAWDSHSEEALVYDTWLKSAREDLVKRRPYDPGSCATDAGWFAAARQVIDRIIYRDEALIRVAEFEGLAIGWVCFSGGRLHYAYVKHAFRDKGVFMRMHADAGLPVDPLVVTHVTTPVLAWQRSGRPIVYDPTA